MEPDILLAVPQKALGESVLRAVGRAGEYTFAEIYNRVKGDYGSISERAVFRYLSTFVRRNWVKREGSRNASIYSRGPEYVEWWRKEKASGQATQAQGSACS